MSRDKRPLFVLGLGCQRSGTTWLHRYLNSLDQADLGPIKEYRIWDAKFTRAGKIFRPSLRNFLRRPKKEWLRWNMVRRPGFYERFFEGRVGGGVRLTGDITPYYALLSADDLERIRRRLEQRGFRVVAVYFMRDPIERCWSAARYFRRSRDSRHQKSVLITPETRDLEETDFIRETYQSAHVAGLTDYRHTVRAIEQVFPEQDRFFGLYEDMFKPCEMERLAQFLGTPVPEAAAMASANSAAKTKPLDPGLEAELLEYFKSTYDFCGQRFPRTRELWRSP